MHDFESSRLSQPRYQFAWMQVVTTHSVLSRAIPPGPIRVASRVIKTEILGPEAAWPRSLAPSPRGGGHG